MEHETLPAMTGEFASLDEDDEVFGVGALIKRKATQSERYSGMMSLNTHCRSSIIPKTFVLDVKGLPEHASDVVQGDTDPAGCEQVRWLVIENADLSKNSAP